MSANLVELVQNAGIVGAGGAGFPTQVKLNCTVDTVVVNGAECEPLLRVDQQLMALEAVKMLTALQAVMDQTQAKEGIIGLKKKYTPAIEAINKELIAFPKIRMHLLKNFYPAGDEQVLVYETTGRIVPEAGIPLNVGTLVINVETLINIYDIMVDNKPVMDTYLTLTGEVKNKLTTKVPLGITVREALELAGGTTIADFVVINGGPMMGKIVDLESTITKTTKGLIVLAKDHSLIISKTKSIKETMKMAGMACMQCNYCTELCPRYALGHNLEPHKLMRIAAYGSTCDTSTQATNAFLCCECGLCQYACVMDLQPWKFNAMLKREFGSKGIKNPHHNEPTAAVPFREGKQFNVYRLVSRLGLTKYDLPAPMVKTEKTFSKVNLLLSQHIGAPAVAVVNVGDHVERGQLIGDIPEGKLSSKIFASISGRISAADSEKITIES
ncbi:4Fe-4S dicluster domain-containing protein [Acetobacterium sp. K1/6]|jgi:Predicted NADH:ubiquinone oxidoreductase, subunit RnfC|uniref:4Fe-4S dicluster domain-containing protein n=1 Tax=Acetobacterium sp. K1/6 TaxID=3055467 RepID=UPI002ACABF34|nr:4Fe-4S dicluster domain-containing protein [Acetobacterium sp. K1/6]MDZ5724807.1 4Fe-4S dicluster domain-containing protein [Acetobacterium sp. K1/6]